MEKKPRADPNLWAEPGKAHANMKEVLFYSFMLCTTHRGRVEELNKWAKRVLEDEFNATHDDYLTE